MGPDFSACFIKNNLSIADGEASLDLGGGWIRVGRVIPLEVQVLGLIHEDISNVGSFTFFYCAFASRRGDSVRNRGNTWAVGTAPAFAR